MPIITESIDAYHDSDPISSTGLKELLRSPAHYQYWLTAEKEEPTPAMRFGQIAHAAIIEPKRFLDSYRIAPDVDRRTKIGKEMWEEFQNDLAPHNIVLKSKEVDTILGMVKSIQSHPAASKLLTSGVPEQSIYFEMLGHDVKTRPDYINYEQHAVVDLKTSMDASYDQFQKQMDNLDYALQSYLQFAGVEKILEWNDHIACWIAVEKDPPYCVAVYVPDDSVMARGRILAEKALLRYKSAIDSGRWIGYGDDPIGMSVPAWRMNSVEMIGE